MSLTFNAVPQVEQVIVRQDGRWLGRLIRSAPGSPVWACRDLRKAMGGRALTVDGTMAEAEAQVRRILGAC